MIFEFNVWRSDGFCMVSKPPPMSSASSPRVLEVGEDTEPAVESYFATSAVPETIDESIFDGSFTWVLVTWYMSRSIYQNLPESTRIHQNLPVVLMWKTRFDMFWPTHIMMALIWLGSSDSYQNWVVGTGDEKWTEAWGSPTSETQTPGHLHHSTFSSF